MLFNAPEVMPTIQQVEHTFGATHPGVFDAEKQTFTLNFRGISFCFNVDSKFQVYNPFSLLIVFLLLTTNFVFKNRKQLKQFFFFLGWQRTMWIGIITVC